MAARIRPVGNQAERDAISLGRIEQLIDATIEGSITCPSCKQKHQIKTLDSSVIAAMRIRYDKLRPSLTATELTTISDDEKLDDNQLLAMLADLIEQHPDLVQQALAAKARKDAERTAPSPIGTVNADSKTA